MKNKVLILIMVIFLLLNIVTGAIASDIIEKIDAAINYGIKITINGELFEPVDDSGVELRPIIYEGRSYLPLRAVAEAVDMNIAWDEVKKEIALSEKKPSSKSDDLPQNSSDRNNNAFDFYVNDDNYTIAETPPYALGNEYYIPMRSVAEHVPLNLTWFTKNDSDGNETIQINLSNEENSLSIDLDEKNAWLNGAHAKLKTPPTVIGNRIYIPIDILIDIFKQNIEIDSSIWRITFFK